MTFNNVNFDCINNFINAQKNGNLVLSGLLSPYDLLLIKFLIKNKKKILYVTLDEQSALKNQKDLKNLLDLDSEVLINQEISFYSELEKNYYIYQEQINILLEKPSIVFAPVKTLLEKFNNEEFYKKNILTIKKNDEIDYSKISKTLVSMGYKRVTTVSDIGEFALRGDILDIYALCANPYRIEFFADTVEDIRFFNAATQKSFKNIEEAKILPIDKFILDEENKNNFKTKINETVSKTDNEFLLKIKDELTEKIDEEGYFEGIEYYQNYFIQEPYSVLDFLKDYILIFKESSQIFSKYELSDEDYKKNYTDSTESNFKLPLETLNHYKIEEFKEKIKKFKILSLDNFLNDDYDKIIEFDMMLPPVFSSDIKNISKFIKKSLNENYKIHICSNFPNRLKEIFSELEIFSDDIFYHPDISTGGAICVDSKISSDKILILSDKELFNKHTRDITVKKYTSNKQSQDFIDSINDIKTGEYVVHAVHGIGIYNGTPSNLTSMCSRSPLMAMV